MNRFIGGIDLHEKKILEIGYGFGFMAVYLAIHNPNTIIHAIDENSGNGHEPNKVIWNMKNIFGLDNLKIINQNFNTWNTNNKYDIIYSRHAIHHLPAINGYRPKNAYIHKNPKVFIRYHTIFNKIYGLLKPNGQLLIWEVSRNNIVRLIPNYRNGVNKSKLTLNEYHFLLRLSGFNNINYKSDIPYKLNFLENVWNRYLGYFGFPDFFLFGTK